MLRIVTAAGREIIYWPDAEQPFMAFDSERAVYRWLKARFMGEHADKAITRQFLRGETSCKKDGERFFRAVSQLLAHDWRADIPLVNLGQAPIVGDPFVYLRDVVRQGMTADARERLTSTRICASRCGSATWARSCRRLAGLRLWVGQSP